MWLDRKRNGMRNRKQKFPTDKKLWNQAETLAKNKFRNYPSMYSSLWASRWYKEHGGEWSNDSKESVSQTNNKNSHTQQNNKIPLMEFEQYADDDNDLDKNNKKDENQKNDNNQTQPEKQTWLREPWVDISRPVIDEAGNVIGFHPCGSNSKDVNENLKNYRTSYPRCMPRSKALRLNAIEREKLLVRNRYLNQEMNSFEPQYESEEE
jgi:hypothetical protein